MKASQVLLLAAGLLLAGCGSGKPAANTSALPAAIEKNAQALGLEPLRKLELAPGVAIECVLVPAPPGGAPFYIGRSEVTQHQYAALLDGNPGTFQGADLPVESLNWTEAQTFCMKLAQHSGQTVRLPTRAEWQFACRAGSTQAYTGGDDESALTACGWYKANAQGQTQPVRRKLPNAWGLYDLHGNVWEWCADAAPTAAGAAQATEQKVICGGSWMDEPEFCRADAHTAAPRDFRNSNLGFRVVLELKTAK